MSKKLLELIQLPTITDDCELTVAENSHLPFAIQRIHYIHNMKNSEPRGMHAHKKTKQILFCLHGSVRMVLESVLGKEEYILSDPPLGILLDAYVWHEMHDISSDTILLVLASHTYEEADFFNGLRSQAAYYSTN
jgi:dTDP-4-dehydrorhamnose 3,5-epimerase-like enzyme